MNPVSRFQCSLPSDKFKFHFPLKTLECEPPAQIETLPEPVEYPPPPLTQCHIDNVIKQWNADFAPSEFQEAGCTVCGQLTPVKHLSDIKHMSNYLSVLECNGVTWKKRDSLQHPIQEETGPVLDRSAGNMLCDTCRAALRKGNIPKMALAHGLWLGDIPEELKDLRFYEKMLIARVQHTRCFVRVQKSAGNKYCKLVSNVVAFENPTPQIYSILPPPRKDLDNVLAIMFSGTVKPTAEDYKNALLLVRQNVVANAINYLIVNHADFADVTFSPENLAEYPEDVPPVAVEFFLKGSNRNAEGVSVHDNLEDDGIEGDECVFTVHGIVG
ncbi:hypothetical protein F5880DRAFT_1488497, partial [Lentinula raphanica]